MQKILTQELTRYVLTGALSVGLNTLIIVALTSGLGLHYLLSTALCFLVVTGINFGLNRYWAFGKRGGAVGADFGRFLTVVLINIPVSIGLSYLLVEYCGLPYFLASATLSLLFVPITFLLHRQWSFALRWPTRE